MLRLPASLERRLIALFPRARDRERFVVDTVEQALQDMITPTTEPEHATPTMIGGELHLYTDGGSRGNPGLAAIGCVLIDPQSQQVLREHGECIGVHTNNIAEYQALIKGLVIAEEFHPNALKCHLDSELVVRQLTGEYRVKMATFEPLIAEIRRRSARFPSVTFVHVPRARNAQADALVNAALDAHIAGRPAGMKHDRL